jgi:putrescine transport system permease protein
MRAQPENRNWSGRAIVLAPYVWLLVFFLAPFVIVFKISLSQTALAQPPYLPVFDLAASWDGFKAFLTQLSADSYRLLSSDALYLFSYLKSVQIAAVSTAVLLALGYPIAYGIARAPRAWQSVLVMAVVLPFWTSFLIRVYAWINILQRDGLLNDVLMRLHLIDTPAVWLSTDTAIYIGVVYSYLPFMVLPLYAVLEKMDETRLSALENVLAGDVAAVATRCRCRCSALLYPDRRRVRHPRSPRRIGDADDWTDALDRVLFQPRLAGRFGNRGVAARPASAADPFL